MQNVFSSTNTITTLEHGDIRFLESGRVFFLGDIALVKLPQPIPSNMQCSRCNQSVWNAHNFSNAVHVCPAHNYKMVVSEFKVDFPLEKKS